MTYLINQEQSFQPVPASDLGLVDLRATSLSLPAITQDEIGAGTSPLTGQFSHIYLEGTDACGKDTIADTMIARCSGPARKTGAFFMHDSQETLDDWSKKYPDPDLYSPLLLIATVRDLCLAGLASPRDLAEYQASHNAIRGTAYATAFGLPLHELYDETTGMLPGIYLPVALRADLEALGKRVMANPRSTQFDYMVIEQPGKIAKMLEVIEDRCRRLGGIAVDTTRKTPDCIVDEIISTTPNRSCSPRPNCEVLGQGRVVLSALRDNPQYEALKPLIDKVLGEIYAGA